VKLLAVDTSTRAASVAVTRGEQVLAELRDDSGDHSDRIIAVIDETLAAASLRLADLDAIAVGAGPGSFTGLRIGMATVKGLAFAADKPLWAVSSLAAVASRVQPPAEIDRIAVVADARRKEVFAGVFDARTLEPVGDERVLRPAELGAVLGELGCHAETTLLVGEGLALYPDVAGDHPIAAGALPYPTAVGVARVARAGSRDDVRSLATPVYIRPSEAEIRFPDGNPGGTFAPQSKKSPR
jgi:tRNA threonylcarbamoyladenosine biosynthesis protein TsaB